MGTCNRCGDTYESYEVYITDNPLAILAHQQLLEDGYENLCKPCRAYLVKDRNIRGHAFTTENEHVEPKENPDK